jgi:hypothetical protein
MAGIGWDQLVPDARHYRNPACSLGKKEICPSLQFPPELAILNLHPETESLKIQREFGN